MRRRACTILFPLCLTLFMACAERPALSPPGPSDDSPAPGEQDAAEAGTVAVTEGILISELLLGLAGSNSAEFIELYNPGSRAIDMGGYVLYYGQGTAGSELQLYAWKKGDEIPGLGHYLLVRDGQDFGVVADAHFDVPLFERKGGLLLRDGDGKLVDRIGWGEAPEGFFAGAPVAAPKSGSSLERLPGGSLGNGKQSGDNAADLSDNGAPNPQNTGSPLTPLPANRLQIELEGPDMVEPATLIELSFIVTNFSDITASPVEISVPLPDQFTVDTAPLGATVDGDRATWTVDEIPAGGVVVSELMLRSPNTYVETALRGYYADSSSMIRGYGAPQLLTMAGGSIPISVARDLIGSLVTVEGISTMYTGGFFAGTTGTKFYMEDESGGIQVYVPEGNGVVEVGLGERVRATGMIEVYRDSIELVPVDITADVERLVKAAELQPSPLAALANEMDSPVYGQLAVTEGIAVRIEEFTYSYEIDLMDGDGNPTLVYIDKLTGVSTEPLDLGKQYRVTGISEFYNGEPRINPRRQSDIGELFPPVMLLELTGPLSGEPGEELVYQITAYNHTDREFTNVSIVADLPPSGVKLLEVNGDAIVSDQIVWSIPMLPGEGGSDSVSLTVLLGEEATEVLTIAPVSAKADQWTTPANTPPFKTFVGSAVPIWAIQGSGMRSPLVRNEATVEGIVTGVFPELDGFWIQAIDPDDAPTTSDGLFVLAADSNWVVNRGDLVHVTGRVREVSGQTTLQLAEEAEVAVLRSGIPMPEPVSYDPPGEEEEALLYNESLEGMLVQISGPSVAVAPTTRYGEAALIHERWQIDSVRREDNAGMLMFLDDGSAEVHYDQSSLPFVISRGSRVSSVVGPLAFTFGNYKIEPASPPTIVPAPRDLPETLQHDPDAFVVATFNVENLFDTRDPHPSSPPKPTLWDYRSKLGKLADAIIRMGLPDLLGLQEVENIDVLQDLLEREELAEFGYVPYLIEGTDSRGIDVAFLARQGAVTWHGAESFAAAEGITSRPPLVISATLHLGGEDHPLYVLNNHFTSLAAGEEATEPQRNAQAAWNVEVMSFQRDRDQDALFMVMGDLNSFIGTLPIDMLQAAGLRHVYEWDPAEVDDLYTYIFEGRTQTLDHILVSEELFGRLQDVRALHINADYPVNDEDDPTARRVSDHDPLIAVFSLD